MLGSWGWAEHEGFFTCHFLFSSVNKIKNASSAGVYFIKPEVLGKAHTRMLFMAVKAVVK